METRGAPRPGTAGRCHCGAVELRVPNAPGRVRECHCSVCRRYGTLWAYYAVDEVTLSGPTACYSWGDRTLDFHRCTRCGCVMAWMPRGDRERCGINARMLDGFDSRRAEIEHSEGPA